MADRINLGRLDLENHLLREYYGDPKLYGVGAPPTAEQKKHMATIVLAIAGADGKVTPTERATLVTLARAFGATAEAEEVIRTFDPSKVRVETMLPKEMRGLSAVLLYDGIRVARTDGFAAKERAAAQRVAKTLGLEPSLVRACEALLDVEDATRASRHQLVRAPKDLRRLGSGPLIEEGAQARALEFGEDPVGMPADLGEKVAKSILTIAAADGALSETEMAWFLGHARSMGMPMEALEQMIKFDPVGARLEDYLDANMTPKARTILFDAVRVARVDGFADAERAMARRGAQKLGIESTFVEAVEAQLRIEDALRGARIKLLAPTQ